MRFSLRPKRLVHSVFAASAASAAALAISATASAATYGTLGTPDGGSAAQAAPVAPGAPPPVLTHEHFYGGQDRSGTLTVSSSYCNPSGTSWFTYKTAGLAVGPYPGTFSEQGTVFISRQTDTLPSWLAPGGVGGRVVSFTARFTITSPNGTVYGVKHAQPGRPISGPGGDLSGFNFGNCLPPGSVVQSPTPHIYQAGANVDYYAVIRTPTGHWYSDHGLSDVYIDEETGEVYFVGAPPTSANVFEENFRSQQAATTPVEGGGDN